MAAITRRAFAGAAAQTTITAGINSTDLSIPIASATGWPSGASFYVVIDPGQSSEEKVLCTRSGTTLTVASTSQRGVDGTTASSHSSGAVIYPCVAAADLDEANQVAATLTTKGDLLGFSTSPTRIPVGTNAQVLIADSSDTEGVKWGQVGTDGIADDAITAAKIAANAVGSSEIADNAVTNAKMADDSVDSAEIVDGAVDKVHLGTDINPVTLRVGCSCTDSQSIPAGSSAKITWGTDVADPQSFTDILGNVTVPTGLGGLYALTFHVETTATRIGVAAAINGVTRYGLGYCPSRATLSVVLPLSAGDTLDLYAINDDASSWIASCYLHLYRIGA